MYYKPTYESLEKKVLQLNQKIVELEKDVDDQLKTNGILKQKKHMYQQVVDTFPGLALLLKSDGEVLISNKFARDLGALPGKSCYLGREQKEATCPWCLAPEVRSNTKPKCVEVEIQKALWDVYWIPVQPDMFLHVAIDVDKRKNMETKDPEVIKMEMIRPFASNIVHDFNNILAKIIGYTEKAQSDIQNKSTVLHSLDKILNAIRLAEDLNKQILSFSGHAVIERQPVEVYKVVQKILEQLKSSLPETIELRQDISTESTRVRLVENQLDLILKNLCSNAVHAMKGKNGVLTVTLFPAQISADDTAMHHVFKTGHYLKLAVEDNGCGMDAVTRERMFDPYVTTKEIGEGYGLGLHMVRAFVKKCGGAITVDSELGVGTTVSVFLPRYDDEDSFESEKKESVPSGNEHILFVDDDRSITSLGKYNLERLGYKVETFTHPIKALDQFRYEPDRFQLVITDMSMPFMNGEILARGILQIRPDIPIILCTGFSELIDEERALSVGIREFLMKPITIHDLAKTVRMLLDEGKSV